MFWADLMTEEIISRFKSKVDSKQPIIIRDEKTASGRVHVGSLRGLVIHGIVSKVLSKKGIENIFYYEINDFDPMDGMPAELDEKEFGKYMGQPLNTIPSPDGKAENFAEYYGNEFKEVIKELGFNPTFLKASELYKTGKYNETITKILDNADLIRKIYKEVSKSEKSDDWYPLNVVCEKCGKIGTTKVIDWDGEKVKYICGDFVKWAKGCDHEGEISPYDGNAKLPWKVEWTAKFFALDVNVEGAGKDHSTKGGARDLSNRILREVFQKEPPYDIPYEFLLIEGKKMSSSKGIGVTSREMADLLPPEILNLLLLYKKPNQALDFSPDGDSIPFLFDTYDRFAGKYFEKDEGYEAQIFELINDNLEEYLLEKRFLPRFSQIVYLVQMPHLDILEEIEKSENIKLSDLDKKEIEHRIKYAKIWLNTYAPDKFKFEIKDKVIDETKDFSDKQKKALFLLLEYVKSRENIEGKELHSKMHDIKEEVDIEAKEFFTAIYLTVLGKTHGPKAGWFLSVIDKTKLEKLLSQVV